MKKYFSLIVLLMCCVFLGAETTSIDGLFHYVLENGLELYVMENDSAPLVSIEIALHAGGIAQEPETAGLFHLYEHMMFKGNTKFPTAAAVQAAISDMGVASWNGSTGSEYVNYYFTVPSYELENGLEFWAIAVREPLLDQHELEAEKKVVLSEINGSFATPAKIMNSAIFGTLFPDFPWRLDPAGDPAVVDGATVSVLRTIKDTYYVPNNAALFVGGDVKHDEVYALVKKHFASWNASTRLSSVRALQNSEPFTSPVFLVFPDDRMSDRLAAISIYFRGPDTCHDTDSTYAADVWGDLLSNPSGKFVNHLLADKKLGIPDPRYSRGGYSTASESGLIIFDAIVKDPSFLLPIRAKHFLDKLQSEEIPAMIADSSYFSDSEFDDVKQRIEDDRVISCETASGFLSELRFWWAAASGDYFMGYHDKMKSVTREQIGSFLSQYIVGKNPLVVVTINPVLYQETQQEFAEAGFTEITEDSAYWWKKTEVIK